MNFNIDDAAKMVSLLQSTFHWKEQLTESELVSLKRATDALCDFIRARAETIQGKTAEVVK